MLAMKTTPAQVEDCMVPLLKHHAGELQDPTKQAGPLKKGEERQKKKDQKKRKKAASQDSVLSGIGLVDPTSYARWSRVKVSASNGTPTRQIRSIMQTSI